MKKLNLGCGKDIKKGFINLDCEKLEGVDVIHDLNKFPYPFKNNTFKEIHGFNILEHLENTIKVMEEIHRIGNKGCKVIIRVPSFNSYLAYADPTHKKFFTYNSFNYFREGDMLGSYYTKVRFKIKERRWIFDEGKTIGKINKPVSKVINKIPIFYQRFLAYMLPCSGLCFELEVIK